MTELLERLLLVGLLALAFTAALSPLESLGWWAGWFHEPLPTPEPLTLEPPPAGRPPGRVYLVFMSGIGSISGKILLQREVAFLERLARALPDARIVSDVFPYAPGGQPLTTGRRLFPAVWGFLYRQRQGRAGSLAMLINLRNAFQVAVSADHRYGPVYNYGTSRIILEALVRAGYPLGANIPVVLLGVSGGGQIALGAATYLDASLNAPIEVVTLGGVMAADPGLKSVRHLHNLYGTRDWVVPLGPIVFPGRWPIQPHSPWNTALRQGRITQTALGPMRHAGKGAYLDDGPTPDGKSHLARTIEAVAAIVGGRG